MLQHTSEHDFGNGEVLTKAIRACLTDLHFNRMNAGVWTSSENSWDSKSSYIAPGGAHLAHSRYWGMRHGQFS